ncbi:hypothetical protein AB0C32_41430, partial [Streptosporangium sp. NPDC048865]
GDIGVHTVGRRLRDILAPQSIDYLVRPYDVATGGWLVGRRYGSRLRHGGAGRRIGERRWSRAERLATGGSLGSGAGTGKGTGRGVGTDVDMGAGVGVGSGPALAAACFLPVVGSLVPIVAGSLRVPYTRFIRRALVGGAVWVSVHLSLGSLAGEALRQNRHLLVPISVCVAVVAVGLIVINHRARPPHEGAGTGDTGEAVSGPGGSPGQGSASRSPR